MIINPKSELSSENYLCLYWYNCIIEKQHIDYKDFQPSQSLIEKYNNYIQNWKNEFQSNISTYKKPIDWNIDRPKTNYYVEKLNEGTEFQNFIENCFKKQGVDLGIYYDNQQLNGENELGIEIKADNRFKETGNLYIEYAERMNSRQKWTKSGILKDDNTKFWLIGNPEEFFIVKKSELVKLFNIIKNTPNKWINKCKLVKEIDHGTSKGFIVKKDKMDEIAYAKSIEDYIQKEGLLLVYITTYTSYYHRNRNCQYIKTLPDEELKQLSINSINKDKYFPCKMCNRNI